MKYKLIGNPLFHVIERKYNITIIFQLVLSLTTKAMSGLFISQTMKVSRLVFSIRLKLLSHSPTFFP